MRFGTTFLKMWTSVFTAATGSWAFATPRTYISLLTSAPTSANLSFERSATTMTSLFWGPAPTSADSSTSAPASCNPLSWTSTATSTIVVFFSTSRWRSTTQVTMRVMTLSSLVSRRITSTSTP